jgi:type IV secretory pathway VirD2 relaxase
MAGEDDDFIAQIGKIGSGKRGRLTPGRNLISRVTRAANLARGGRVSARGSSGFTGRRSGRAYIDGVMLKSRSSATLRRVMVKSRIVKLSGRAIGGAAAHMRYIQRDGVTREGQPGDLYDQHSDHAEGRDFLSRSEGDRHQFRFIVSPEDGAEYDDLKSVTRRLMDQMEKDLGTHLDWVAVDHFNTGHPHTHILVRGKDDQGKDLVIARDYITHGIRERVSDIVSLDLGPRSEHEIAASLKAEVSAERYTGLDRQLSSIRDKAEDDLVRTKGLSSARQSLLTDRLQHLSRMGLAGETKGGGWRLDENLEPTLKRMGKRGDIINSLTYDLKQMGQEHLIVDAVVHDQEQQAEPYLDHAPDRFTGRLVRRGLWDEADDRHYIVMQATDGRTHVIDIGEGSRTPMTRDGVLIEVEATSPALRKADVTIDEVAKANHGHYDVEAHLDYDPHATSKFAEAHVRRLEAVRRGTGEIEHLGGGMFKVPSNYLDVAMRYEQEQAHKRPAKVQEVSPVPLDKLVSHNGATWLDRELTSGAKRELAKVGFGAEVTAALEKRRQWLINQDLASIEPDGTTRYRRQMIAILTDRELTESGNALARRSGHPFGKVEPWERIEGHLRDKLHLTSGDFAVVQRSKDFVLVPWREVLEPHIGKRISAHQRDGGGIDWEIGGRSRGLSR